MCKSSEHMGQKKKRKEKKTEEENCCGFFGYVKRVSLIVHIAPRHTCLVISLQVQD